MYIVEMNDKNIVDVADCYLNSWNSSHAGKYPEGAVTNFNIEKFINILKKDNEADRITFIAYDKNNIIGFITIDKESSELTHLYVVPARQRQGMGTKLLEFGIKQMTGVNRIYTTVLSINNIGIAFFEQYGFEFTGEQRALKSGILEFRYVFRKRR